jgi:Asp-tRNA(Asn)/Glu-tRNA(Gln) amidotransferase A subunit family amidase
LPKPIRVAVTPGAVTDIDASWNYRADRRAAGYLRDAGYEVVEAEPPSIMEPARGWFSVLLTELKATLGPIVDQYGSDEIRRIFDWSYQMGKLLDLDGYRAGLADRTRMMRAWSLFLDTYPLVLTPFLMRPTYPWNYDAQGSPQIKDLFDAAIYSYGVNYLGLPAGVCRSISFRICLQVFNLSAGAFGRMSSSTRWQQSKFVGIFINRLWARGI